LGQDSLQCGDSYLTINHDDHMQTAQGSTEW
jgi:hypothetical protein